MNLRGIDTITGEYVEVLGDRVISGVEPLLESASTDTPLVAPGFIDLQVNGFAGVDFNSLATNSADVEKALAAIFSTGVTRFFPTLITNAPKTILALLRKLVSIRSELKYGAAMEGFHIEGPHISAEDGPRGAHPRQFVRPPDHDEFLRWQEAAEGLIKMVTLAPEWPGACAYIEQLVGSGVVVALGHTRATAEQIHDAVLAGATVSTHLGNGAGSRDREDPFIQQQLKETRLTASFIVDGHHLPSQFLREALAAKGSERSTLVTDAAAPAGCAPGLYDLGEVPVELRADGRVTLRGNDRLAGSSLTMDRAIGLVMEQGGVTLAEAIVMATSNPARAGRVANRRGLRTGERADVVQFRMNGGRIEVESVYLSGDNVLPR